MIVNKQLANSSGCIQKDLWATPDYIFKPLNDEFNFTLDPCCTHETAKCDRYFTPDDDGLSNDWSGNIVFVNPPYSRGNIDKWMMKCHEESLYQKTVIVALIPVSTSARWWHKHILNVAELRFYKGRIRFIGAKQTAPFSSAIAIFGSFNKQSFKPVYFDF